MNGEKIKIKKMDRAEKVEGRRSLGGGGEDTCVYNKTIPMKIGLT